MPSDRAEYDREDGQSAGLSRTMKLMFAALIGAAPFVALGYMGLAKIVFAGWMVAAIGNWLHGAYQMATEPFEFEKEGDADD